MSHGVVLRGELQFVSNDGSTERLDAATNRWTGVETKTQKNFAVAVFQGAAVG